ncbi:uncharacterized protein LOC129951121 [Eupeodes corollae]|uniref:uncharacterized protein LOC129951121 n=1 Tax=Eupeodes corollae TaxID=290404 RepID=UPI0024934406|nr:uncharacterized protein LOC129951121 [Eupeodes corollae]
MYSADTSTLNNSDKDTNVFLKCLSKYYENEFEENGSNYRKVVLRDAIVKAYNKKFKTKLKPIELLEQLKMNEKSYQPYEWQKLFLDVFNEGLDEPLKDYKQNQQYSNVIKLPEIANNAEKKSGGVAAKSSSSGVASIECKPDLPIAAQEIDYKSMSVYELKRALLVSKLEMLEAQEALKRTKEEIRLNEEEHLKRNEAKP